MLPSQSIKQNHVLIDTDVIACCPCYDDGRVIPTYESRYGTVRFRQLLTTYLADCINVN